MPSTTSHSRHHALIILTILAGCAIRIVFPSADPPVDLSWSGGYYADEGFWAHDARNIVLWGEPGPDEWHDACVSPLIFPMVLLIFKLAGTGLVQVRIWAQLFAVVFMVLIWVIVRREPWRTHAMMYFAFCSILVAYQRIAILESAAVLGAVATCAFWLRAHNTDRWWWYVLCGAATGMTYITKGTQVYLVPVVLTATVIMSRKSGRTLKRCAGLAVGMGIIILVWLLFIVIPNRELLQQYNGYYASQHGDSIRDLIRNLILQPLPLYFNRFPLIFPVAWLALGEISLRRLRIRRSPVAVYTFIWLMCGIMFFSPLGYRPLRYYLPLVPALILLGCWRLMGHHDRDRNFNLQDEMILGIWLLIPVGMNLVPLVDRYLFQDRFLGLGQLPGFSITGAGLTVMAGLMIYGFLFKGRIRYPGFSSWLFVCAVGIHLLRLGVWTERRSYDVVTASRTLEELVPGNAVIAGQWAPQLCLNTSFRAIPLWKGFVNDSDPFRTYGITHLLSWEYPLGDELQLQKEWFPEVMNQARLIHTFQIKNSPVHLWEIDRGR